MNFTLGVIGAEAVGEEGVEAALAGVSESDERVIEEVADLWFHSYVLLASRVDKKAKKPSVDGLRDDLRVVGAVGEISTSTFFW